MAIGPRPEWEGNAPWPTPSFRCAPDLRNVSYQCHYDCASGAALAMSQDRLRHRGTSLAVRSVLPTRPPGPPVFGPWRSGGVGAERADQPGIRDSPPRRSTAPARARKTCSSTMPYATSVATPVRDLEARVAQGRAHAFARLENGTPGEPQKYVRVQAKGTSYERTGCELEVGVGLDEEPAHTLGA